MHPRRYETMVLMAPNLAPEEFERLKTKIDGIISEQKGQIIRYDDWGRRRLAYPVHKEMYGHYVLYDFQGSPELTNELERNLKIEEHIYKYLTLVISKKFTDEDLNQERERQATEKARLEAEQAKEAEARAAAAAAAVAAAEAQAAEAQAAEETAEAQAQAGQPEEAEAPESGARNDDEAGPAGEANSESPNSESN